MTLLCRKYGLTEDSKLRKKKKHTTISSQYLIARADISLSKQDYGSIEIMKIGLRGENTAPDMH